MKLALEQAELAAQIGEVPIGAVVVCDGEVIAVAHNRREIDNNPSAHAEFLAMQEQVSCPSDQEQPVGSKALAIRRS